MRIIAGRYKRQKLQINPGLTTRPIVDRAKQKLFDRLESDLENAKVLDVFSGTGSMGLEALSRGASTCVFIERDHKAHELLRSNVAQLKVEEETMCWRTDAIRCSYRPKGLPQFVPFDVIFFDPPYEMARGELKANTKLYQAIQRLACDTVSSPTALLVLRIPEKLEPEVPEEWFRTELEIAVGSMRIRFYEKGHSSKEEDS